MKIRTLEQKLLIAVTIVVLTSGFLISFLVTHRYSVSLHEALIGEARYLTEAIALEAADLILTRDLVALQKLLDQQRQSNPSLAYLMVVDRDRVLAHTFAAGVPEDLIAANTPAPDGAPQPRAILGETGEHILDLAFPIFHGRAGTLRVGYSESGYRRQVNRLRWQMAGFTLLVLLVATAGGVLFIRRITGPVKALAQAVNQVDQGEIKVVVAVQGDDEVAGLARSFNQMVERLGAYTSRLEQQTAELARAHDQTRTFCRLVQEIGSMHSLREIGRTLIDRFLEILHADWVRLILVNELQAGFFLISAEELRTELDPAAVDRVNAAIEAMQTGANGRKAVTGLGAAPFVPPGWGRDNGSFEAVLLSHEQSPFGILLLGCGAQCRCGPREIELARTMAEQAAGVIRRAILHEAEVQDLHNRLECSAAFCGIVGKDPTMQTVFKLIEDIAPTDATVLIQGESGTGKELVARAIHQQSLRGAGPFVVINCSAYPATLLESELFGHEKGAFTGANRLKPGRFEQADGGTVFLDEIGEVPASAQIRLLRVLQTQEFERLGGTKTIQVNVRILAATNRDLIEEVKQGRFREDLFYRLNVIPIRLPSLAERQNDIPLLARHFLRRFSAAHSKPVRTVAPEAMRRLLEHPWPGNVRELENSIEHAVVLAKNDQIEPRDLPRALERKAQPTSTLSPNPTLLDQERKVLEQALEQSNWNKKEAAKRLGISRSTLYAKLTRHRLRPAKAR